MTRRLLASIALFLASTVSGVAHADDDLQAKFEQAQQLYEKLNYKDALPLFEAAFDGTGSPNASLYVGRCLRELGRVDEAYEILRETRRRAAERAAEEQRFVETRDAAVVELKELEPHVGRLYITVTEPPDGLAVSVGGKPVPEERLARIEAGNVVDARDPLPIVLKAGAAQIEMSAPGYQPHRQDVQLRGGPPSRLTLPALKVAEVAPVPTPVAPPEREAEPSDVGTQRIIGVGLAGAGVVGLGIGTVFGIMALGTTSDADELCDGTECSAEGLEMHDDANGQANVANVGFAVGIGLLVAGAVVYFTAEDHSEVAHGALRGVRAGADASGAWLGWGQTW